MPWLIKIIKPTPIAVLFLICLAVDTTKSAQAAPQFVEILQQGQIIVGTINSEHDVYLGAKGYVGFDYDLASAYANYLQVGLTIKQFYDNDELFAALRRGDIDIAAPRMPLRELPKSLNKGPLLFSADMLEMSHVAQDIPCSERENPQWLTLNTLSNSLQSTKRFPNLSSDLTTTRELLVALSAQSDRCGLLLDAWFAPFAAEFSSLSATALDNYRISKFWTVSSSQTLLLNSLFEFIHQSRENGTLEKLITKTRLPNPAIPPQHAQAFVQFSHRHMSAIRSKFASQDTVIEWPLLVALFYVEKTWQPNHHLAVEDPLLIENIDKLSDTLDDIYRLIPARIQLPDKHWMLIAAYFIGQPHLEDARELARAKGTSPDMWVDVKQQLPLLELPLVYRQSTYGFANGSDAVEFVSQVRFYADLLKLNISTPAMTQ